jgi:hypothetical protein
MHQPSNSHPQSDPPRLSLPAMRCALTVRLLSRWWSGFLHPCVRERAPHKRAPHNMGTFIGSARLIRASAHAARAQVEARLRQLEGRMQAGESARPRGKPELSRYEPERQGGAALLTAPASYNAAADVTATAGKEEKKKARLCRVPAGHDARLPVWLGARQQLAMTGTGGGVRQCVPSTVHISCDCHISGNVSGFVMLLTSLSHLQSAVNEPWAVYAYLTGRRLVPRHRTPPHCEKYVKARARPWQAGSVVSILRVVWRLCLRRVPAARAEEEAERGGGSGGGARRGRRGGCGGAGARAGQEEEKEGKGGRRGGGRSGCGAGAERRGGRGRSEDEKEVQGRGRRRSSGRWRRRRRGEQCVLLAL